MNSLSRIELYNYLNAILSYQFNQTFATSFLRTFDKMTFSFSKKTSKIKHLYLNNILQATYRPPLGTFSISINAAIRIFSEIPFPQFRVQVKSEVAEFIRQGKSVFAKHVILIDPTLKIGNEVFVVDEEDNLLAIGKLSLPPKYFPWIQHGSAVKIRQGLDSKKGKKS